MPHDSALPPDGRPQRPFHRFRHRAVLWGVVSLSVLMLRAESPPVLPHNFGVKDGTVFEDPREANRASYPMWPVSRELPNDVFTFARLRYNSETYSGRWGRRWLVDYPDSDLNFSFRLQQLTALQVNPRGAIVDIDPVQMRQYPFIYMIEVGGITLTDEEVRIIREYLLNGGFIMVDDFWGTEALQRFHGVLRRMFPNREPKELPLSHDIFHIVFDLKVKPQIPNVRVAVVNKNTGITHENRHAGSEQVHYQGVFDDKGRMMMLLCHNTDLGDGWEEEGTDPWFFKEFSEKYGYPMGINIIFYAMTH